MRKVKYNSSDIGGDDYRSNFIKKKPSWMDDLVDWFHDFLETSE
jgi:hypothetical protein